MENGYIDRRSVYEMRCEMREGSTALRQWQALFGAGVLACPGGETLILAQSVRGNSASQGDVSEPACSRSRAAHMTGLPDTSHLAPLPSAPLYSTLLAAMCRIPRSTKRWDSIDSGTWDSGRPKQPPPDRNRIWKPAEAAEIHPLRPQPLMPCAPTPPTSATEI